jgi:hypothetical protein
MTISFCPFCDQNIPLFLLAGVANISDLIPHLHLLGYLPAPDTVVAKKTVTLKTTLAACLLFAVCTGSLFCHVFLAIYKRPPIL